MNGNKSLLRPALVGFLLLAFITGIVYTVVCTGIGQLFFSHRVNGSMITAEVDGQIVNYGSEYMAQTFTNPKYLIGRPSNEGAPTNLNPVSDEQATLVQQRVDWWHQLDPENIAEIPMDLVTVSGSGYDPDITPEAAAYQIARIAKIRGISEEKVRQIINDNTTDSIFGFLGDPIVNVLKVNLALDGIATK